MTAHSDLLDRYKRIREVRFRLNNLLVGTIPKKTLEDCGRKLGLFRKGTLVFGSEDEMSVLMDYCLYHPEPDGRNLVAKYLEKSPPPADSDEMGAIGLATKEAIYPTHGPNDLATLLANAMSRPLARDAHRPGLIRLRGHHQWRELFPVLEELGIEISVEQKLPGIEKAYRARIRQMREEQRTGMVKPTEEQAKVKAMFPAIARYVQGYGYVEIGDQESFGFVVRALGYGGLDYEDDTPETLAEATTRSADNLPSGSGSPASTRTSTPTRSWASTSRRSSPPGR